MMELAEAYIHVAYRELTQTEFQEIARELEAKIAAAARGRFTNDASLKYSLEQGTLKAKARIFGSLVALYAGISEYPQFREGVIKLYDDAKTFSTAVIEEFKKVTGSKEAAIISKRTVPTSVYKLRRIVNTLDALETMPGTDRAADKTAQAVISDMIALRRVDPSGEALQALLTAIPKKELPQVPSTIDEIVALEDERRKLSHGSASYRHRDYSERRIGHSRERQRLLPRQRRSALRYERTVEL